MFGQAILLRSDVSAFFVTGDASRSSKEGCGPTHAGACIDVCKQCLDAESAAFALLLRNPSLICTLPWFMSWVFWWQIVESLLQAGIARAAFSF